MRLREWLFLSSYVLFLLVPALGQATVIPSRYPDEPSPSARYTMGPSASALEKEGISALKEWVSRYLQGTGDEFLRIKMLHDWVALHISYDTEALFSERIPPQDIISVLRTKKAVCEGYARLFQALSQASGTECAIIRGEARLPLMKEKSNTLSHAWNAVKIRGTWYPVDTTWDAGFLSGEEYQTRYSAVYLFIPPEELISTHFPEEPRWQLLAEQVTREEFFSRPLLTGIYFEYFKTSTLEDLREGTTVSNPLGLRFISMKKGRLSARVFKSGTPLSERLTWVDEDEETLFLSLLFPEPGTYDVLIFAGETGEARMELAGEIKLSVAEGVSYNYPVVYKAFEERKGRLLLSPQGVLKQGERATFRFLLPGYAKAAFVADEKMIPLEKEGDGLFYLSLTLPSCEELTLYGADAEQSTAWDGLLRFTLEK